MARPEFTRPMQAAVVVALLVAAILVWVGAPRRHRPTQTVVIDSVSAITTTEAIKPDSVAEPRKPEKKEKKKATKAAPKSRDYLDERIN